MKFESLAGGFLVTLLSVFCVSNAAAESPSIYLYHLTPDEFLDTLNSDNLQAAEDLTLLKSFVERKYNMDEVATDALKKVITREDFEAYQKETLSNSELAFSNPTCICR
jgi:hypothetical protein